MRLETRLPLAWWFPKVTPATVDFWGGIEAVEHDIDDTVPASVSAALASDWFTLIMLWLLSISGGSTEVEPDDDDTVETEVVASRGILLRLQGLFGRTRPTLRGKKVV